MALTSPSSCSPLSLTVPPVHCPTYASPFSGFLLCRRNHGGPVVAYCGAISPPISDSRTLHRVLEAYSPQSSIGWKSS